MFLIFDTETTGLPRDFKAPLSDFDNWPRLVQLAWQLHDDKGELLEVKNYIIKPNGFTIPYNSEKIHGISTERAEKQGVDLSLVLDEFEKAIEKADFSVGHNIGFDNNIMGSEYLRNGYENPLPALADVDTMKSSVDFCAISGGKGGRFKFPKLGELHFKLFNEGFDEAHNAAADVEATARVFLELIRISVIPPAKVSFSNAQFQAFREENPDQIKAIGLNTQPYNSEELIEEIVHEEDSSVENIAQATIDDGLKKMEGVPFSHLHNHSQYSVLQATSKIEDLIKRSVDNNMPAVALSDLGNMYAAFNFVSKVLKHNKHAESVNAELVSEGKAPRERTLKPILGCEFFVCNDHLEKSKKDNGYQIVALAKNKRGYHNLSKLSSTAFVDGFYYVPRIDKKLLLEYKEDIIILSGGLYGEISSLLLNVGDKQAKEAFDWWKEQFGDDFYLELIRHGLDEEDKVNEVLLKWGKENDVKCIAANNTFYIEQGDAKAHDILLCVKEGEKVDTPIGRGRGFRYGFPNDQFYFKSTEEMKRLFWDIPESIINTNEVIDKIEIFDLASEVLLPEFDIPEKYLDPKDKEDGGKRGENAYLRFLTYEGAKRRYDEITDEIRDRLDFELETIQKTGYPGYFLIVQDFTSQARKMGVAVGPGRGSAAGSAVAYCTEITNVDPIAYDLLFERFLNPDRVSLPDIDIDFDDEGRSKIIDWVVDKYGSNQVAQIITYGSMAAKSSIRDTGRVLDLPLNETDQLAKLIPDNISLGKLFSLNDKDLKAKVNSEQMPNALEMKSKAMVDDLMGQTINQARKIEGSVRNTGLHACGIIIAPDDLTNHVPVAMAKDSSLFVTQFDNSVVEDAGLLKMDFLGLKTLSIIKDAIILVKEKHGVDIDPDEIPLDDELTYKLYQKGSTNGTFQFESPGMQKHLRNLKPDKFEDLIAMNALYRPGPIEYIPDFIARKNGREAISFDVPEMEEYLAETYGITVYQEQVMLLSQKLAGFTKGEADGLRKAMGKKIKALLDKLKPKFVAGCDKNNIPSDKAEKIWGDWEKFAAYAFNKSHSTCYSVVAFQTAYLKAHYPAEYMSSVLTHNMNDIKKVTFFMEECRRMGLDVLGPCVNESGLKFRVNDKGEIRFGLGGIKGVGENAVQSIIDERLKNGPYTSLPDLTMRVESQQVNKRVVENLALAGAIDTFNLNRSQLFKADEKTGRSYIETSLKFGSKYKESQNSSQVSMFDSSDKFDLPMPVPPTEVEWGTLEKLKKEREVVGIFITGHPLDDHSFAIKSFCRNQLSDLEDLDKLKERTRHVSVAGMITFVDHRISQKGNPWGRFTMEDYNGSHQFSLFGKDYLRLRNFIGDDWFVFLEADISYNDYRKSTELKINSIIMLAELIDVKAKALLIDLELENLDDTMVEDLVNILEESKGKVGVKMRLFDNGTMIELKSRKRGVQISKELTSRLSMMDSVKFKLV